MACSTVVAAAANTGMDARGESLMERSGDGGAVVEAARRSEGSQWQWRRGSRHGAEGNKKETRGKEEI